MVETFRHFKPSIDGSVPGVVRGASPKSNTPPRSTKNGSSEVPQKTFSPVLAVVIAL